ncbi:MAG: hypothetical protein CMC35_02835 [Flavobacteriaceae bacterium]|nr:hypothetical protein [Flavobacteriaceae bacterium]
MNRVGVLKDVAYGLKAGGGTVASINEAADLAAGAMAVFGENGVLLAADGSNAAAAMGDSKEVIIAFGRTNTPLLVNVPRNVKYVNLMNYRAAVKPTIVIGGQTADTGLPFDNEGEASIKVVDNTHTSRYGLPAIKASVYKTPSMTIGQLITKLVNKLNADTTLGGVTAVAANTGDYYQISITPKENIAINVALSGMFMSGKIEQTVDAVYPMGTGSQIKELEFEASVEMGNQAYTEHTTDWYKDVLETNTAANYDVITIGYDAWHQGPTTKRHVMAKALQIAAVNGATVDADAIMAILANVFPNYASETEGQEIVADDGTELDGVAGN